MDIISDELLRNILWIIFAVTGGSLVFLLFIPGTLSLGPGVIREALSHREMVRSLNRSWLVLFLAWMLAALILLFAFPTLFAVLAGGAWLLTGLIPAAFLLQGAGWRILQVNPDAPYAGALSWALAITGMAGMFLSGVVLASFFTGSPFTVDPQGLASRAWISAVTWKGSLHGLEALNDWRNMAPGLAFVFLGRLLGNLRISAGHPGGDTAARLRRTMAMDAALFLLAYALFVFVLFTRPGYAYHPVDGFVMGMPYKYFSNLVNMPPVLLCWAGGLVFILLGMVLALFGPVKKPGSGFLYAGAGALLTGLALLCLAGLNYTVCYTSVFSAESCLTIRNCAANPGTLVTTGILSLASLGIISWSARSLFFPTFTP